MYIIKYATILQMLGNFCIAMIVLFAGTAMYNTYKLNFSTSDRLWKSVLFISPILLANFAWQLVERVIANYQWNNHVGLEPVPEWMLTLAVFCLFTFFISIFSLIYHIFRYFFSRPRRTRETLDKIGKCGGIILVSIFLAFIFVQMMVIFE